MVQDNLEVLKEIALYSFESYCLLANLYVIQNDNEK